jgi:hypothetical protein
LVLVAALVKAPQVLAPMGQDQGLYHTIAQEILRGGVLYRDAWDPKPPGVFYTHAALLSVISDPWRPCRLGGSDLQPRCGTLLFEGLDFVYSLLIAGLVYVLARRLGYASGAAVLAFGFTAVFVNLARMDPEGSTPEKYALAPAVGVMLAGVAAIQTGQRRWLVLAGLLAAVAALFKLPDLASFGAVSLFLVWLWLLARRRYVRTDFAVSPLRSGGGQDLLCLWIPLLTVLAGVWVAFALVGAGGAFFDATLGYNLFRFGFQSTRIPLAGAVAVWQMFRDGLAPLWLPALLGVVFARRFSIVLLWAALDVVALFLGGTKFTREYFIQLVPSFSMLAALGVYSLWQGYRGWWPGRAWLVSSLGALFLLSSAFQAGFTMRVWNEYVASWTINSVEHLAVMVAALPPDETLFLWGNEAELYPLSGRLPTTRFLNTAGIEVTGDPSVSLRRAELFQSLTAHPPAVIVIDAHTADDDPDGRLMLNVKYVPELQSLLSAHYRQMSPAILRPYVGGDREQVYVRTNPDLCVQMPGCHY